MSSCAGQGAGAGSCASSSLGLTGSEASFEAGSPIDIPAPIAKNIEGVDPSSIRFSVTVDSSLQDPGFRTLQKQATQNAIGIIYGALESRDPCTEATVLVIAEGEVIDTQTTSGCSFQYTFNDEYLGVTLSFVVYVQGYVSAPVQAIVKATADALPSSVAGEVASSYVLQVYFTNVDADTVDSGVDIQNSDIAVDASGSTVAFSGYNASGDALIGTVSLTGGVNEELTETPSLIRDLFYGTTDDPTLVGVNADSQALCYYYNAQFTCNNDVDVFESADYRSLKLSPNRNYVAYHDVANGNQAIGFLSLVNPSATTGRVVAAVDEDDISTMYFDWADDSIIVAYKKYGTDTPVYQDYDDVSSLLTGSQVDLTPNSENLTDTTSTIHDLLMVTSSPMRMLTPLTTPADEFFMNESYIDGSLIDQYLVSSNVIASYKNCHVTSEEQFVVCEMDTSANDESSEVFTDNVIVALDLNVKEGDPHYLAVGTHPFPSPADDSIIVYLSPDEFGNMQVATINLDYVSLTSASAIAPTLIDISPAHGATDVDVVLSDGVQMVFSKKMDTTATINAISNTPYIPNPTAAWSGGDSILSAIPGSALIHNTTYTYDISVVAEDINGLTFAQAENFSFTTRNWNTETVIAGNGGVKPSNSAPIGMAFDTDNILHVVDFDSTQLNLQYTKCDGSCTDSVSWSNATNITGAGLGRISLSFTENFQLTLGANLSATDLIYMQCDPGAGGDDCTHGENWNKITFAGLVDAAAVPSINSDGDGPVIAYLDSTGALSVKVCTTTSNCNNPANWAVPYTVDNTSDMGAQVSLLHNSDGYHVIYTDGATSKLKYASCTGACSPEVGPWTKTSILPAQNVNSMLDAAVIEGGSIHVAYINSNDVYYAACSQTCTNASNWSSVRVGTTGLSVDGWISMAVDSNSFIHILSQRMGGAGNNAAEHFYCSEDCQLGSGAWSSQLITPTISGSGGFVPSVAIDSSNALHVMNVEAVGAVNSLIYAE